MFLLKHQAEAILCFQSPSFWGAFEEALTKQFNIYWTKLKEIKMNKILDKVSHYMARKQPSSLSECNIFTMKRQTVAKLFFSYTSEYKNTMWFHFINTVDKEELLFLLLCGSGESSGSVVEKSIFQAKVFAGHSSGIREIQFEENIGLPEGILIAGIFEVLRWLPFWVNTQARSFICQYRNSPLLLML